MTDVRQFSLPASCHMRRVPRSSGVTILIAFVCIAALLRWGYRLCCFSAMARHCGRGALTPRLCSKPAQKKQRQKSSEVWPAGAVTLSAKSSSGCLSSASSTRASSTELDPTGIAGGEEAEPKKRSPALLVFAVAVCAVAAACATSRLPAVSEAMIGFLHSAKAPIAAAAAVGGPISMFTVTPLRNALTLAAAHPEAGVVGVYRKVFRGGFEKGWVGGLLPAMASSPQFLCLGPVYYSVAAIAGPVAGVTVASFVESLITFSAETVGAQMAKESDSPGSIKEFQPTWRPWGPGFAVYMLRNILSIAGLRLISAAFTKAIAALGGSTMGMAAVAATFAANTICSFISAPVHQVYCFIVTTPEYAAMSALERRRAVLRFLEDQYFVEQEGGGKRLSSTFFRDLFLRCAYNSTVLTMFLCLEQALISTWTRLVF
eukprot:TRINITY_DN34260_c0_g1_i2.p1 TRINITY_DN34260_c0_g1~~TRINITY_DN34260_c0_g1_i2.p1  ORF type:complete len:431 (+),score=57.46 TRINITY_DN34260_c0_g1_i2:84-1376(+)